VTTKVLHDQAPNPQPDPQPPGRAHAAVIVSLVLIVVAATVLVVTTGGRVDVSGTPTPAQLRATVTSMLTGAPLAATLELPDGTAVPVEANGTVAIDRVGPGDQVGVIATGYVTAQVPVGPDRTITATLQPTFATVTEQLNTWAEEKNADAISNWVFSPATGLRFTPIEDGTDTGDVPWSASREVEGKFAIVNAAVAPGVIAGDATAEEMFDGKGTPITLAGQPAWHGPTDFEAFASLWIRSPLMIMVTGVDLSTTDAVLAAMIAAQPAR
jgi:hypothetical protein